MGDCTYRIPHNYYNFKYNNLNYNPKFKAYENIKCSTYFLKKAIKPRAFLFCNRTGFDVDVFCGFFAVS